MAEPMPRTNLVRNQYLAAGSKAVWVIYRKAREVYILRAGGATVLRGTDGVLEDQEMLPGSPWRSSHCLNSLLATGSVRPPRSCLWNAHP